MYNKEFLRLNLFKIMFKNNMLYTFSIMAKDIIALTEWNLSVESKNKDV